MSIKETANVAGQYSRPLTTDAAGELHVLGHNSHTLGVDSAKVGVLEEANHVGLGSLLEGEDGGALETEVVLEGASDVADESLERKFPDEELSALLELADLTESNGARAEPVGALDATGLGGLGGLLSCDVLAGVFSSGALASGHLGACHLI